MKAHYEGSGNLTAVLIKIEVLWNTGNYITT